MSQPLERTRIWTGGVSYGTPTLGNLAAPLREQFRQPQGDVNACISIGVSFIAAVLAMKPSPVVRATNTLATTSRTRFARVVCRNSGYLDSVLMGGALNDGSELCVWRSFSLAVRFSTELRVLQAVEVFDSNRCSISFGEGNDLMCDLVTPRAIEVPLMAFEFLQCPFSSDFSFDSLALQLAPPQANVSFDLCHILPEIKLSQNPALANDGDGCQARRTDIHSHDRLLGLGFLNYNLSPEIDYDNPASAFLKQAELGKSIAGFEQGIKPSPSTISSNRQPHTFYIFERCDTNNRIVAFGFSELPASRYVIIDYRADEPIGFASVLPDAMHGFDEDLTLKIESFSSHVVGGLV
jgi:hypothetical protein